MTLRHPWPEPPPATGWHWADPIARTIADVGADSWADWSPLPDDVVDQVDGHTARFAGADLVVSIDALQRFPNRAGLQWAMDAMADAARLAMAIHAINHDGGRTGLSCIRRRWDHLLDPDIWTLDQVRQGRRTRPDSIDHNRPAWYVYRRIEPAVETQPTGPPASTVGDG